MSVLERNWKDKMQIPREHLQFLWVIDYYEFVLFYNVVEL